MKWRLLAGVLALLLVAALVPVLRHLREVPPSPDRPVRFPLLSPQGTEFGSGIDVPFDLAIAPSGREILFTATAEGESQLWRRQLETDATEPIGGTTGAVMPAYSADGSTVWYFANGRLRTVNLANGERRDMFEATAPAGVAVRRDDVVLIARGSGPIERYAARLAQQVTSMRPGERTHAFPSWAGTGDAFVYLVTHDDGRRVLRLDDGDTDVELTRTDSHGVVAHGHLLRVRESRLVAEPLDVKARRLGPRATTIALDVGVLPDGRGLFAVADRLLATARASRRARVLRWIAFDGSAPKEIAEPGDYWQVRLSPDERTVAVTARDALLQTLDVFTVPATGGQLSRLTLALSADTDPVWSPDGRRVAFRSFQAGQPHIYARALRGKADEPVWRSPLDEVPSDWRANRLFFHARSAGTGFDVWSIAAGGDTPAAVARSGFNEVEARVSPDGRWIAYVSDESGQRDVYVQRLDGTGRRTRVSNAGGARPQWTANGRALVFLRGDELMRTGFLPDEEGGSATVPKRLVTLEAVRDYAIAQNGTRVLAILPDRPLAASVIRVVMSWRSLLH